MLRILYSLIVLLGTVFGVTLAFQVPREVLEDVPGFTGYSNPQTLLAILIGGLGYLMAATLSWELEQWCEAQLPRVRIRDVFWGAAGLLAGVMAAVLLLVPLYVFMSAEPVRALLMSSSLYQTLAAVAGPFLMILFGYLGIILFSRKQADLMELFGVPGASSAGRPRVLDTSVIIDGRVALLVRTGLVDGLLVVPQFVLGELQYIADAGDPTKRQRGQRGFEILEELKRAPQVRVEFVPDTCAHLSEVDAKLVYVTRELKGILITNDMNLHKLAVLQNVPSVNLTEVSNALRPMVQPGERLELALAKRGKEPRQGVGYLNDGTMVVVEEGASELGTTRRVVITSALQTSAGRLLFARIDHEPAAAALDESGGSGSVPRATGPTGGAESPVASPQDRIPSKS